MWSWFLQKAAATNLIPKPRVQNWSRVLEHAKKPMKRCCLPFAALQ